MTYSLVYIICRSNPLKKIIDKRNDEFEAELEEMRKYNSARLEQYKKQMMAK